MDWGFLAVDRYLNTIIKYIRENKIDPIPVQVRDASEASQTLQDLKDGKIIGRATLVHK